MRGSGDSAEEENISGLSFLMAEDEVFTPMPSAEGWDEDEPHPRRGEKSKNYRLGKKQKKFSQDE